jgi:hypothetical protein
LNKKPARGKAELKLVPRASAAGLKKPGGLAALSLQASQVDEAFGEAVDQHIAKLFNG